VRAQVTIDVECPDVEQLRRLVDDLADILREDWSDSIEIKGVSINHPDGDPNA
jgi:hypothetical protein